MLAAVAEKKVVVLEKRTLELRSCYILVSLEKILK